jgi:REP element-mobilizing transposase RayT
MHLIENQFYHIYNRGNNKENIFLNRSNYVYFLNKFKKYLLDKVDVYSYCLMPNHFHLLTKIKPVISTKGTSSANQTSISDSTILTPVEKGFKDFFISYSKSFNKLYQRTGSLFQYKFKRKLIDNQSYLLRVIAYIHQNPLRWGLCTQAENWEFSSYGVILKNKESFIKKDEILGWYNGLEGFKSETTKVLMKT